MSYTTVNAVKLMLGITGTGADAVLTQLVSDADVAIDTLLNIDGFDQNIITEDVPNKQIRIGAYGVRLYLKNFNVTEILSIDGVAYTGVIGTDYLIKHSRMVEIKNFISNISGNPEFSSIKVEYEYGYDRTAPGPIDLLPAKIELMARLLVVGEYTFMYPTGYNASSSGTITGGGNGVSSYRLGEEAISWKGSGSSTGGSNFTSFRTESERNLFQQLLAKYTKVNVLY